MNPSVSTQVLALAALCLAVRAVQQVARGEARNVEVIKDIRNTYSGEGFWVRVYAAG